MSFIQWYVTPFVMRWPGLTLKDILERPVVDDVIYLGRSEYEEYCELIGGPPCPKTIYYRGLEVRSATSVKNYKKKS